ncbi:MAG TPA: G1 family glutamic endopeptidase [Streptosporangiaceae bacterium]
MKYLSHGHPGAMFVHPAAAHAAVTNGTTKTGSFNWSGYATTSTTQQAYSRVSGKWVTPKISCPSKEDMLTSEWVGIDGFNTGTVEQDGSLDWCFRGKATYFTWYEMYPAGTIEVGRSLRPGDHITAVVSRSGTSYTLKVTDSKHHGSSFTKHSSCAAATCLDESAEWIAERPEFSIGMAPLGDFHSWTLTSGTQTRSGKYGKISEAGNDKIEMIDATDSYDLATTSSLSGGNKFKVSWHNSW